MARQVIHGFESGTYLDKAYLYSGTPIITSGTSAYGLSGSYFLNMSNGRIFYVLTAKDYYYLSFRVYFGNTNNTNYTAVRFQNSGTVLGAIKFDLSNDGYCRAYRDDGSTVIATGTKKMNINTAYRVEIYYKPSLASGDVHTRIDGVADITVAGQQTSGTAAQVNQVHFGIQGGAMYIDDVVFDDASWVGNTRIQGLVPNGVGNSTQFSKYPATGDNYDHVDEMPYNDADYNYSNTVDHLDLFAMSALDESLKTISTIKCLDIIVRAKIDGVSTPTEIAVAQRVASTNYAGTDQVVAQDNWGFFHQIYEVNPNTSVAYLKAEINGIELGYKARS